MCTRSELDSCLDTHTHPRVCSPPAPPAESARSAAFSGLPIKFPAEYVEDATASYGHGAGSRTYVARTRQRCAAEQRPNAGYVKVHVTGRTGRSKERNREEHRAHSRRRVQVSSSRTEQSKLSHRPTALNPPSPQHPPAQSSNSPRRDPRPSTNATGLTPLQEDQSAQARTHRSGKAEVLQSGPAQHVSATVPSVTHRPLLGSSRRTWPR